MARSDNPSVIVAGARTPIGKLAGALKDFTAMDLGGFAIAAALERSGVTGEQVDYVVMGHVLQAGQGQITARQAAVKGGIPMDVPALTINKVCLSGLSAIALADQLIRAGEVEIVVAGGMESMTGAPYLLPKARQGYRFGNAELVDATFHDGLFDAFDRVPMGEGTERHNARYAMTREEQDDFAARSHELAAAAIKEGRFADEIVPVSIPQRKGDPIVVSEDEGVRPGTTPESLAKLRPAFTADGAITAGNASQISDGAAAVVVMSRAKADELREGQAFRRSEEIFRTPVAGVSEGGRFDWRDDGLIDGRHFTVAVAPLGAGAGSGARALVTLIDRSNLVEDVAKEIVAAGGKAIAVIADLETYSGNVAALQKAAEAFGKIDILVTNVGGAI